jgi:hypothetical protein
MHTHAALRTSTASMVGVVLPLQAAQGSAAAELFVPQPGCQAAALELIVTYAQQQHRQQQPATDGCSP